jgi:translation initiation factor 2 beta subunit (eIF-2beta)/eIF-5
MELYTDDYLIDRICKNINKTGTKLSLKKPIIQRKNGKTLIINFPDLHKSLNRSCEELKDYLDNEMNLTSSILSTGILSIDKFYQDKDILATITKFINAYVICPELKCKSGKTEIIKSGKLYFLTCRTCNAKKSIDQIIKKK